MSRPVRLADRPLTRDEARAIVAWRYEPPFDFYELSGEDPVAPLTTRDERGHGFYPVQAGTDVLGYVCFGAEGRVRGQEEEPGTLDVGMGLAPDRLSQGVATALLPEVVRFARERFGATRLRAAVAAFNDRSLRLCTSAGFRRVREFPGPDGRPFVELVRNLPRRPAR
jgi:[ribosomal protein S18]-alanine N-acetyltransferase